MKIMPGDGPIMPGDGPKMPGDGPIMENYHNNYSIFWQFYGEIIFK